DLERVERSLQELGRSPNPLVAEINDYLFQPGGKRIRPALLILSAKIHGYRGEEHIFWSALVEVIHTASLIHDDIIDNADRRRGRETVHTRWGSNITVLLGDFLYIQAIKQALATRRLPIIDIMAEVTAHMIEGELLECSFAGDPEIGEARYFEILERKTASLFSAACRIGGILGEAGREDVVRLGAFGTRIGLAFQVIDDLLDFTGRPSVLGKPVLSDLREGRITLPLILTLGRLDPAAREGLKRLILERDSEPEAIPRIQALVTSNGALQEAAARAARFADEARSVLDGFPESPATEAMRRLGDFILARAT
ncbi:MAG: polyprenyl synthetase family protein, partial [Candidatus Aminicenantes bacterium]|nr:polyprenyl synthetase family protein [Candidatus Aminicenantes bacterium]